MDDKDYFKPHRTVLRNIVTFTVNHTQTRVYAIVTNPAGEGRYLVKYTLPLFEIEGPVFKVDISGVGSIAISDDDEYVVLGNEKEFILCHIAKDEFETRLLESPLCND